MRMEYKGLTRQHRTLVIGDTYMTHWFILLGDEKYEDRVEYVRNVIAPWCRDQFGRVFDQHGSPMWTAIAIHFTFQDDNHAFEFRMRWC